MNYKAKQALIEWDPFNIGNDGYDSVASDVVNALHTIDSPTDLAKVIQTTYEPIFKRWIPFDQCVEISYQLLAIKFKAKSIV